MKLLEEIIAFIGGIFIFIAAIGLNLLMLALPVVLGIWLARYFGVL